MGLHALSACWLPTSQLPAIRPECLFLISGKVETKFQIIEGSTTTFFSLYLVASWSGSPSLRASCRPSHSLQRWGLTTVLRPS